MTIIEKIKQSVEKASGLKCYYQSDGELNRIFDNAEYPCAFFTLLEQGEVTTTSGNLRERVRIAMFFVNLTTYDFNAIENEQIIDAEKNRAFDWLLSLRTDNDIRLISVNGTQRAYAEYDAILTGFAVNVTIEELFGVYTCSDYTNDGLQVMTDAEMWAALQVRDEEKWNNLSVQQ